ncbi:hypothetical protein Pph01_85720 [Planotetraspora phitsanulokensis]|uniref:Uncharacterized protein n=1 Tax=Planotetraspora phitsanulokensis TaxID=575192 RepID=A0A8J3UDN7_9ACTN|nr:hypothetical protein Pph01_85720 [Planotetraspora phitsanulokensis]
MQRLFVELCSQLGLPLVFEVMYTPSETIGLHTLPVDLKGVLLKPDGTRR